MSGVSDDEAALVEVEGEAELGPVDDRTVQPQLSQLEDQLTVRQGGQPAHSDLHISQLNTEELGQQQQRFDVLGLPSIHLVYFLDWRVVQDRQIHPSGYDGDQVTGLAAEDAGGESEIVDMKVDILDLKSGLKQLETSPDTTQTEGRLAEEERDDPGYDPGQEPTGEQPTGEKDHQEPGVPHLEVTSTQDLVGRDQLLIVYKPQT